MDFAISQTSPFRARVTKVALARFAVRPGGVTGDVGGLCSFELLGDSLEGLEISCSGLDCGGDTFSDSGLFSVEAEAGDGFQVDPRL